jgi:hydroxymethylbilane synthase
MSDSITLRVGTRGSDLALWQTNWITSLLANSRPDVTIEQEIITTHGDANVEAAFDGAWPVGSFVSAIEAVLMQERVDFAVHSFKDLTTQSPDDLVIAAVPPRADVHDVLLTREAMTLDEVGDGFRVGSSSPRRAAQMKRHAKVEIVPLRGNVPTRVEKLNSGDYDGVILAAAGLNRLGITPEHTIVLPTGRFVPAPAQGAVAVQVKRGTPAEAIIASIDDFPSHRAVRAERSLIAAVEAGCQTPVGALATLNGDEVTLHAQLFSDDGVAFTEGSHTGDDPVIVGRELGLRLRAELAEAV